jgi:hypothetical protein
MIPTSIDLSDTIREVLADIEADPYLVWPFMSPAFAGLVVVRTIKRWVSLS